MNVQKELPIVPRMQLVLIHLLHISAPAKLVTKETASLVTVSEFIPTYFVRHMFVFI